MGERYNIHSQLEHLQSKYIGTGHADTTKWEWVTHQHRDSYSLYVVSVTLHWQLSRWCFRFFLVLAIHLFGFIVYYLLQNNWNPVKRVLVFGYFFSKPEQWDKYIVFISSGWKVGIWGVVSSMSQYSLHIGKPWHIGLMSATNNAEKILGC